MAGLTPAPPAGPVRLAIPFRIDGTGRAVTVAQNSLDDITQSVRLLCATPLGSRTELPAYGVPDQSFRQHVDTGIIARQIATWEPRADVTVTAGPGPNAQVTVTIAGAGTPPGTGGSGWPAPTTTTYQAGWDGGTAGELINADLDGGTATSVDTGDVDGGTATPY